MKNNKPKIVIITAILVVLLFCSGIFWPYFRLLCSGFYVTERYRDLELPPNSEIEQFILRNNWKEMSAGHDIDTVKIYSINKKYNYFFFHLDANIDFSRPIVEECMDTPLECYNRAETPEDYRDMADYTKKGHISINVYEEKNTLPVPKFLYKITYRNIILDLNNDFGFDFSTRTRLERTCT